MRKIVSDNWVAYTAPFESNVTYLYPDVLRLVSIGLGLKVDPIGDLLSSGIQFVDPNGFPATSNEVIAAWNAVKHCPLDPKKGSKQFASIKGNEIRATPQSLQAVMLRKLLAMETELKKFFPGFDNFCADIQLVLLSKAWANGPDFAIGWPHFAAAINAGQWVVAAKECVPSPEKMAIENKSYHDRIGTEVRHILAAIHCTDPDQFVNGLAA